MKYLSSNDIYRLVNLVGSQVHVATAAAWSGEEDTGTPSEWTTGKKTPSSRQMERLVVLDEVMITVAKRRNRVTAQQWLLDVDSVNGRTPLESIRRGKYGEARKAATRA